MARNELPAGLPIRCVQPTKPFLSNRVSCCAFRFVLLSRLSAPGRACPSFRTVCTLAVRRGATPYPVHAEKIGRSPTPMRCCVCPVSSPGAPVLFLFSDAGLCRSAPAGRRIHRLGPVRAADDLRESLPSVRTALPTGSPGCCAVHPVRRTGAPIGSTRFL